MPIVLGEVEQVRVDDNGKIMVAGSLVTTLWGSALVMRTHPDGSRDGSFNFSFDPANGQAESLVAVPGGGYLVGGTFTGSGYPSRLARLASNGNLIGAFDLNVNGSVQVVERTSDHPSTARYYIGGQFTEVDGQTRRRIARLDNNFELDASFNPPDFGGTVLAVVPLADGKVLLSGATLYVDGQPGAGRIVFRLNADGSLDPGFVQTAIPGALQSVTAMAVQADGKILIGGNFSASEGGQTRVNIARLNSDGSLDPDFETASQANGMVRDLKLQPDGRIVVVGEFTNLGFLSDNIVRLHSDGSRDNGFDSFMMPDAPPNSVAIQGDGGVLIAGGFSEITGTTARRVIRISKHLGLDQTLVKEGEQNENIVAIAVERDGDLLIGGNFTTIQGETRLRLARLSGSTGTLQGGFTPAVDGPVHAILAQPDGKLVIAGEFQEVDGVSRDYVARLNADGTLDTGFQPPSIVGEFDDYAEGVYALEPGPDGKLYIGGVFDDIGGSGRSFFARLNDDGSLDASLVDLELTGPVYAITHQWGTDRLYLGGDFSVPDHSSHWRVIRLLPDGNLDTVFKGIVDGGVSSLAATPDGGVLIGGIFSTVLGAPPNFYSRTNFARLQVNGWPTGMNIGIEKVGGPEDRSSTRVHTIAFDGDGDVLVGGWYVLGAYPQWGMARFEPDGDMDLSVDFNPGTDWLGFVETVTRLSDGKIVLEGNIYTGVIADSIYDTPVRFSNIESIPSEHLSVDGNGTVTWSRSGKGPIPRGRPELLLSTSCCDDEDFAPLPGYLSWDGDTSTWTYDDFPNLTGTYYLKVRSRIGDSNGSGPFETPIHQFYGGPEPPAQSDLSINITADPMALADGDTVIIGITVSNQGPDAATGVVALNDISTSLNYQGHTADAGTYIPATGEWGIGNLAVGSSIELKIQAEANGSGPFQIKSEILGNEFEPIPANNVEALEIAFIAPPAPEADLSVTMEATTGTVEPGDTVTFEVVLSNLGPDPATGVFMYSYFVEGFIYSGHVASQGSYDPVTGVWTVGELAASGSESQATFKVDALINDMGPFMHLVQAHVDQHDPNPVNDQTLRFIDVVFPVIDALFADDFKAPQQ
ncbi:MAG: hypothetical protein U5L08_04080 [Xanthomonadales bacterium]|nr:hypothetical protein [Xanthomonadales bacterium]